MAAPTFVQEAETSWNSSSTPRTTSSFDVQADDVIVGLVAKANDLNPALALTSGGSLTWTNRQTVNPNPASGLWSTLRIDTAAVDSNKSMTASFSKSGSSSVLFGGNALTFRGSDGIGASSSTNVSNGAPSLGITTTEDDSAVAVIVVDWNASDGSSRVWRQVNGASPVEVTYFRDSDEYTVYAAYYANVGAAGAKTVGLSAPSGQKYSIAAVEILGTEDAGAVELVIAGASHGQAADSISLTQAHTLAVADTAHDNAAESVALTQANTLAIGDTSHSNAVESPTLTHHQVLAVAEALHAHAADTFALTQANTLAISDTAHDQSVGAITLSSAQLLTIAEAIHSQSAESPSLTQANTLSIADSTHAQAADNVTLIQAHVLSIDGATHTHTVEAIELSEAALLQIADALHSQAADAITLSQAQLLAVASAAHLHSVGAIDLAQASTLVIDDALHAQLVDALGLQAPSEGTPPQRIIVVRGQSRTVIVSERSRTLPISARNRTIKLH